MHICLLSYCLYGSRCFHFDTFVLCSVSDNKWRRDIWCSRQTLPFPPWMDTCEFSDITFSFFFWRVISPFLLSPSISSCGLLLNHGYFSDTPITDLLHVISWSSYSLLISGIAIFCIFICVLCQSLQCIVLLPPLKSSVVSIVPIWWNPYIILHCSNF